MEYTVQQLASLAGVSPRTLRYYDKIGLLPPQATSPAGYRIYGAPQIDRLQQILFYRTLGMSLAQIGEVLDAASFDAAAALQQHIEALAAQRARLDTLLATARKTLKHMKGESDMKDTEKFEGFKKQMVQQNEQQYGQEIREKYGDEAVDASNAKLMGMSEEQYAEFVQLGAQLNDALQAAVQSKNAAGEQAQRAAALHKQWLMYTWTSYTPEAHLGLAQMYIQDARFTQYYEDIVPGGAQMLHDAIQVFTAE